MKIRNNEEFKKNLTNKEAGVQEIGVSEGRPCRQEACYPPKSG